jgi:OOP family OmpA-OmpF porin
VEIRMKKTYAKTALLLSGLLAFTGTSAYASDSNTGWTSGLYATASIGRARFDNNTLNAAENAGFSLDDTDIGYSAGVGYEFNKYVAFEAGYVTLGEANISSDGGGFFINESWEADASYLGPKVSLPLTDKFSVFGKIGLFSWDVDYSPSTNDPILVQFLSSPATYGGTDIYFGAGFAYVVTNTIGVKAEWIRFNFDSDGWAFPDTDIDFISAGLVFKFGKLM